MARILGVGIATLDIINSVDRYPREDEELRALTQTRARGGNATNTLVVLSQLGHQVTWAGNLADDENSQLICKDLARFKVDTGPVQAIPGGTVPTSCITLNQQNGSRTIVHYRDLEEYAFSSFQKIDLTAYDWLHFEGRNIEQTRQMLEYARNTQPHIPRSVEIEKPRAGIGVLCELADLLLYSRSYAQDMVVQRGLPATSVIDEIATIFLEDMIKQAPKANHVCTWGQHGAYGTSQPGNIIHVPAIRPPSVVDTLGAGDTFLAGLIHGQIQGMELRASMTVASQLAGQKCGQQGFEDLGL